MATRMTHAQGPVARICVEEISLGRTRGAKKAYDGIARAAASSQWRLPFMVRACLRTKYCGNQLFPHIGGFKAKGEFGSRA